VLRAGKSDRGLRLSGAAGGARPAFHSRSLVHLRRSEGIPDAEGSPQDGHVTVAAKAKAQSSGLLRDSAGSFSKKY
jgi:hypothetical protein